MRQHAGNELIYWGKKDTDFERETKRYTDREIESRKTIINVREV